MINSTQFLANDVSMRNLLDELGKMLYARKISMVIADAATQGLLPFIASQNLTLRSSLASSIVVHSTKSLKALLDIDEQDLPLDQLDASIGAEMARNSLALSQAQLALALTLCSTKHLPFPNCTILGLHWWYCNQENGQSAWMLSQQIVVTATREDLPGRLAQVAAQETIKVLRLQENS